MSYKSPFNLYWDLQLFRDANGEWNGYALAMDGNIQHMTPKLSFKNQADVLTNVLEDIRIVESQR